MYFPVLVMSTCIATLLHASDLAFVHKGSCMVNVIIK